MSRYLRTAAQFAGATAIFMSMASAASAQSVSHNLMVDGMLRPGIASATRAGCVSIKVGNQNTRYEKSFSVRSDGFFEPFITVSTGTQVTVNKYLNRDCTNWKEGFSGKAPGKDGLRYWWIKTR